MHPKVLPSLILSVFSPLLVLIDAIRSSDWRYKHWALTLFITLYGSTIQLQVGNDGYRHREMVYTHYQNLSFTDFVNELYTMLTFGVNESMAQDVYKHLLSYGLVQIGLPSLFFTVVAFVYGYFFSGAILLILRKFSNARHSYLFLAFAFLFLLVKNVEGINTVRTYTGLWVLVYASLQYLNTKKKRYLLLMLAPPFIHVAYFIMVLPAYLFLLIGNRVRWFSIIFILSSFISFIPASQIQSKLQQTELGAEKIQGYSIDEESEFGEVVESQSQVGASWYRTLQKAGLQKWALYILIFTMIFSGIYALRMNYLQRSLFSIGLLTLTLSNLAWSVTALANRSQLIGMVFILAALLLAWQDNTVRMFIERKAVRFMLVITYLIFIPFIIYSISALLDFMSIYQLNFPFVVWIDANLNMSVKEFLRLFV